MRIKKIEIINFRNYVNSTIEFSSSSVVVGCNDAGKTNLLYAIRLLLDKDLPESHLMPSVTDFNSSTGKYKYSITLFFCDVFEDCVRSRLKEDVSENDETVFRLIGTYDPKSGKRDYKVYTGDSVDNLKEKSRYYLKSVHVKYIESSRDLDKYIRQEKNWLLENASVSRSQEEIDGDDKSIDEINTCLGCISEKISSLNYIKRSTDVINDNIKELSSHAANKKVVFKTRDTDSRILLERLMLGTKENDTILPLHGDGFANQTHLSLWAVRHAVDRTEIHKDSVKIYCIEEVESHLHPHQQRRLANFLNNYFPDSQVILTTHSTQIASSFSPESIIRLRKDKAKTDSFSQNTSLFIDPDSIEFGYRLNAISAEIYYSDAVIFVEGPSEVLFYKAAALANNIDLDKINTSIIDVNGIGFEPYIDMATSFGTEYIVRTDNDVMKIPKKDKHRFAGVKRCVDLAYSFGEFDFDAHENDIKALKWDGDKEEIPTESRCAAARLIKILETYNFFIAEKDLEHDIVLLSPFSTAACDFFKTDDTHAVIKKLQDAKATNMFSLLKVKLADLKCLAGHKLLAPLERALQMADARWNG